MKRLFPFLVLLLGLLSLPSVSHAQSGVTIQQSSTSRKIPFLLVQSADHVTPLTGATPTVTISKNGAAFASPAGSVAELGSGWYVLTPTSADTGTTGVLILHATAASADPADIVANVVAYNPDSATNLGLSNLDTTVSSRGTSTYSGADTSGTTTLLSRLSGTRATALDNLDATISSRLATSGYTAPPAVPTASDNATAVWASGTRTLTDKAGFSLSQAFPVNFSLLSINGSGAVTGVGGGGSGITITDVQTALTNQGLTTTRAGYLDNINAAPPTASAIAAAVAGIVIDSTGSSPLMMKQATALIQSALTGNCLVATLNTTTHRQVTTYYKANGTTPICTSTVQYAADNKTYLSRTEVWTNLP